MDAGASKTFDAAHGPEARQSAHRRPGRPKGQTAEGTRDRILDCAEALFAEGGYDGTSIRNIAERADVKLAAIGYHFGRKENLFETVVRRRAAIMNGQRMRVLNEALTREPGKTIDLETLVHGYMAPFFTMARHGDVGWRNYATLMGRLANSPRGTDVISRHYDETARAYLAALNNALPNTSEHAIIEGFMAMVAAMLSICAGTGRAKRLMGNPPETATPDRIFDGLTRFLVGGFRALSR